ncbi:MAG: DUF2442 domain-containing protein [Lachnospiraceae bacterium]|nr:DUF2442 domain-containing protein [Lachnospiraceae bacterium]
MDEKVRKYFLSPRRIVKISPGENYVLYITFDNGEMKKYDMSDELTGVFSVLKDVEKFNSVFINEVGNVAWNIDDGVDSSIHWENQIDLCKDMLYLESVPV